MDVRDKDYIPNDVEVIVNPELVYFFADKNRKDLEDSRVLIARNKTDGTSVYVTLDDDLINLRLEMFKGDAKDDDSPFAYFDVTDSDDCMLTLWRIIDDYLTLDNTAEEKDESEEPPCADKVVNSVVERESELAIALEEFLTLAIDDAGDIEGDEAFYNLLDDVLATIAAYGYMVYRPTIIDGLLVNYPYNTDDEEAEDDDDVPPEEDEED